MGNLTARRVLHEPPQAQSLFKISLITTALLAGCVLTNPDQRNYETYVTDALSDYLIDRVCPRVPEFAATCQQFVIEHESDLLTVVQNHTHRASFGIFSAYTTRIELKVLPTVEIRAIGALARFFPYEVQFPDGTDEL